MVRDARPRRRRPGGWCRQLHRHGRGLPAAFRRTGPRRAGRGRHRDGGHRAGGGLLRVRHGRARRRGRRHHQRPRQGRAGRDHPARGARGAARLGLRPSEVPQLAWVAGGALAIALPTTGWIGFTVAAALLVLVVGLVPAASSAAGPPRTGLPRRPDDRGPIAVDVRWTTAAGLLVLLLGGCASGDDGPGEVRVQAGAQGITAQAVQGCEDGEEVRYESTPPIIEFPRRRHHPHRAGLGGRARLGRAGLRRAARGEARHRPRPRRRGAVRRHQLLRVVPAGLLPPRGGGQGRRLRGVVPGVAGRFHPRRRLSIPRRRPTPRRPAPP